MGRSEQTPIPGTEMVVGQEIPLGDWIDRSRVSENRREIPKDGPDGARHGDAIVIGNNIFRWDGFTDQYTYAQVPDGNTSDGKRLFSGIVCSREDLALEHIEKHRLPLQLPFDYLHVADMALKKGVPAGRNEDLTQPAIIRVINHDGRNYRVVFNGHIPLQDKTYRVVRSVTYLGEGKRDPYPGYVISVTTRTNPRTQYLKPDLPDWTLPTIKQTIDRLNESGVTKATYRFEQPIPHLVRVGIKTGEVRTAIGRNTR